MSFISTSESESESEDSDSDSDSDSGSGFFDFLELFFSSLSFDLDLTAALGASLAGFAADLETFSVLEDLTLTADLPIVNNINVK